MESQASFAALERKDNEDKKLMIIGWLSSAPVHQDQDNFSAAREDIPGSSGWILKQSQIKNWLIPTKTSSPIIWINGKPGAGILHHFTNATFISLIAKRENGHCLCND